MTNMAKIFKIVAKFLKDSILRPQNFAKLLSEILTKLSVPQHYVLNFVHYLIYCFLVLISAAPCFNHLCISLIGHIRPICSLQTCLSILCVLQINSNKMN